MIVQNIYDNKIIIKDHLFYNFKRYLNNFAPNISHIELITQHIWSYISIPKYDSNLLFKLYYEIKNRNTWETDIKYITLNYDEFMSGFIYCVIDKFHSTQPDDTIVPSLRKDVRYFKNLNHFKKWNLYYHISFYGFVLINEIIIQIYDYIKDKMCAVFCDKSTQNKDNTPIQEVFYSINYYNKYSSLNSILNKIICNYPLSLNY